MLEFSRISGGEYSSDRCTAHGTWHLRLGRLLKSGQGPRASRSIGSWTRTSPGSCGALEGCISTEGSFECTWGAGGGPWSREIGETSERSPGMTGGMGNMVAVHRGFCGHCVFSLKADKRKRATGSESNRLVAAKSFF